VHTQVILFDPDGLRDHIESFWKIHTDKINSWVKKALREDRDDKRTTVCISASPDFILQPCARLLGFDALIATEFVCKGDKQTNRLFTPNCKGEEKINRLKHWASLKGETFIIEKFYSDSQTDWPLFKLAKQGFWIKKGNLYPVSFLGV
jgi:phosphatidylglycerophosphatase C